MYDYPFTDSDRDGVGEPVSVSLDLLGRANEYVDRSRLDGLIGGFFRAGWEPSVVAFDTSSLDCRWGQAPPIRFRRQLLPNLTALVLRKFVLLAVEMVSRL